MLRWRIICTAMIAIRHTTSAPNRVHATANGESDCGCAGNAPVAADAAGSAGRTALPLVAVALVSSESTNGRSVSATHSWRRVLPMSRLNVANGHRTSVLPEPTAISSEHVGMMTGTRSGG